MTGRKKNKVSVLETQISNAEKALDVVDKLKEEQIKKEKIAKKNAKKERERIKKIEEKTEITREEAMNYALKNTTNALKEVALNKNYDYFSRENNIREDLINQLQAQGKYGKHFEDMIDDYIYLVGLKEDLQNDISEKGLRYCSMTGNGYTIEKANESIQNLYKANTQMLKILQDLNLQSPDIEEGEGDDLL